METFGLRRTQSLRSLSGVQERSWVMPAPTRWDRKSVSQLVQHYQSCADLRGIKKQEHKLQVSVSCVDGGWRQLESGDNGALWGAGRSSNLSRSRSMDVLPQKESSATKALCALFESKAKLQQGFNSSPRLNASATGSNAGRDCPLLDGRSHKETSTQRAAQLEGRKDMNGLPESSARASRYLQDDKYSSSLTKGSTPTRQSSNKIATSSSVRDRSAVYLSRAAAIDSTGGSAQPEFVSTPGTRSKNSKFDSPAKDMCSACLTPVYPMEKMVANKLILHRNCFCCIHCQKKLSIHNYSSLYGEFYCISHYQQLFKRSGNYDEGFGHMQHKDRWLQKNKAKDEPAPASTPKVTKSNSNMSDGSRKSSAGVYVKNVPAREMVHNSGADVKGKKKMSWPPEKKTPGFNPAQRSYVKNTISDMGRASTAERHKSDNNQIKISHVGEMRDKGKALSSSFTSGINEQSKTTGFTLGEKLPSEQTKSRSDPTKDSVSSTGLNFSLHTVERGNPVTNRKSGEKNVAPTSKTNNQTSNRPDIYPNKARKYVRFAPKVDVAQYDLSSQLTTEANDEEHREQFSDQTEQSKVNHSRDTEEGSDKKNQDQLSFEFGREQHESGAQLEIPENKRHGETSSILKEREPVVEVEGSQEDPQTDITVLNGPVGKVEESLDTQSFSETFNSTQEDVKHQESCEASHVIPRNAVNPCESESLSPPHSQAEHVHGEEAGLGRNTNPFEKTESANDNENGRSQKKPVVRTNSLTGSAKPAEKTKVKLGSWSKGKSPLSKLFTSGGNDKKNKVEPKVVKPGGGLLGRLFQSSSEKAEDDTKVSAQDERNDKTHDDDKKREEVKGGVTKETQKQGYESQVPAQEREAGEQIKGQSCFAEPTMESNTEPSNLHRTSTSETDYQTAPDQTDEHESDLQSSESTTVTDPGKTESNDLPSTGESVSQASEESINQLIAETSGDDNLSAPFNADFLGHSVSSAPDDPLAIQINTDVSAQKPNEVFDASDEGGRDLIAEALLEPDPELLQDSSNPICPSDTCVSSIMEDASTDTFSQLDAHMISAENDAMLVLTDHLIVPASATVNQDEASTSSPSGTNSQTREQGAAFDMFGTDDTPFTQPPAVEGAFASSNQPPDFPDDIFGVSDVFAVLPSSPATSNSLNDLLGLDTPSTAAPSAQTGLFADDIFASEPQLLPVSEPSDVHLFVGSRLVSDNDSIEQTSESPATNSSWMDDLLG